MTALAPLKRLIKLVPKEEAQPQPDEGEESSEDAPEEGEEKPAEKPDTR